MVVASGPENIQDCLVEGNIIKDVGGAGIAVAGNGILVSQNLIRDASTNSASAAIEVRQVDALTSNVMVTENRILNSPDTSHVTTAVKIEPGAQGVRVGRNMTVGSSIHPLSNQGSGVMAELIGAGSPEGVISASVGSTYRRTDGEPGATFYIKESGDGSSGWVAK